jgi:hypothetical protein
MIVWQIDNWRFGICRSVSAILMTVWKETYEVGLRYLFRVLAVPGYILRADTCYPDEGIRYDSFVSR